MELLTVYKSQRNVWINKKIFSKTISLSEIKTREMPQYGDREKTMLLNDNVSSLGCNTLKTRKRYKNKKRRVFYNLKIPLIEQLSNVIVIQDVRGSIRKFLKTFKLIRSFVRCRIVSRLVPTGFCCRQFNLQASRRRS